MMLQTTIDKALVIQSENLLVAAMKASNIEALESLLHDDLLFITPDGQAITKKMDLDSHRSGTMVVDKINPEIETINIIGDTAVITIAITAKGSMMGEPIEGKFRYIRVWKLIGNTLKVIAGSCTPI
jgi:ketosteroid isomerase-like protein